MKKRVDKRKKLPCPLGLEIKDKLIREGMTQGALARMIGANESYLSDIVYGNRNAGKYEKAIKKFLDS